MRYNQIKERKPAEFQRLTGVQPAVFTQMRQAVQEQIRVFGRPCKLSLADQLLLTLMYWREYRSLLHPPKGTRHHLRCFRTDRLAHHPQNRERFARFGTLSRAWQKDFAPTRMASASFGGGCHRNPDSASSKKQKQHYSGKEKRHTHKTQLIVRKADKRLIALSFAPGKTHDFRLLEQSRLPLLPDTECLDDSGYQGWSKQYSQIRTPHKKSQQHPLSPEQKQQNRALAQERIIAEHVIRWLKRFAILAGPYRNRRKRLNLRFTLIAALYNAHLDL